MFLHNFKFTLITLLKNKTLIFWTYIFPIILGTFFYMAFSDIEKNEKFQVINIALVNDKFNEKDVYKNAIEKLSDKENEDRLFETIYTSEDEANTLLDKREITGYLTKKDDQVKIVVLGDGINETILKYVVLEIKNQSDLINNLVVSTIQDKVELGDYNINYEKIYNDAINLINDKQVNLKDESPKNLSYTMIEYYTLIAMTCLYSGTLSMVAIGNLLASTTNIGKRVSVSKISKTKIILSSILASYIVQLIGIAILFIYTIFVLGANYGNNFIKVIELTLVGTLFGLVYGVIISVLVKGNENLKTGLLISFTMLCSFFSGMMGVEMKYIIDTKIPVINKLNPVALITDGFYSLYYYQTYDRYYINVISLLVITVVLIILSIIGVRRQRYDCV